MLVDREGREDAASLRYIANAPPYGHLLASHIKTGYGCMTRGGWEKGCQHFDNCGFTGSVGSQQTQELAARYLQIERLERDDPVPVGTARPRDLRRTARALTPM